MVKTSPNLRYPCLIPAIAEKKEIFVIETGAQSEVFA